MKTLAGARALGVHWSAQMGPSLLATTSPRALTGADVFLRAFDGEARRFSGAGHLSQLVLRVGAGFRPAALRAALEAVSQAHPILRAPVRRRGFGLPQFRCDRARYVAHPVLAEVRGGVPSLDAEGHPPLPELFGERLNGVLALERGELLRCDVVHYDGAGPIRADVAFTWAHMLLDGSGSELFVSHLAAVDRGECQPGELPAADPPRETRPFREQADVARAWVQSMEPMKPHPPRSLAGPRRRAPQDLRVEWRRHSRGATERIVARAAEQAGFLTPVVFYMAAAVRAHHAVFRARGDVPESYVVPLPVNLRAKGQKGPVFQTHVSMLWFQVLAARADSLADVIDDLKQQRRRAIRDGAVEQGRVALDFIRFLPSPLYARMARSHFGGELASFFFAYTEEFLPGVDEFFGAPVEAGCHVPSVLASPGSSLLFSLRGGRLNATHVYQRGVLSEPERKILYAQLERDLAGEEA
ncbi:MAG: hypothetical protein MJE66_05895 [Proteobacteria bacterium]|nr:hypothetical protein [Pseudomonadota bacterium]